MSDEVGHGDRGSRKRSRAAGWALLFAFAGGPLAWLAYQNLAYALFSVPCFPGAHRNSVLPRDAAWVWVLAVAAFLVCAAVAFLSGVVALRLRRRSRDGQAGSGAEVEEPGNGRSRFIASWGVLLGFGFGGLVLANGAGLLLVPPCAM